MAGCASAGFVELVGTLANLFLQQRSQLLAFFTDVNGLAAPIETLLKALGVALQLIRFGALFCHRRKQAHG